MLQITDIQVCHGFFKTTYLNVGLEHYVFSKVKEKGGDRASMY